MSESPGYAAPLLAVDQIVEVSARSIKTIKAIAGNETFFRGHYPHFPIFPGAFVLEAVHQTVRLFVLKGLQQPAHARLMKVDSVRLLSPLRPGDVLQVDAHCRHEPDSGELSVEAQCWRCGQKLAAVAKVKLSYVLEE